VAKISRQMLHDGPFSGGDMEKLEAAKRSFSASMYHTELIRQTLSYA
jgi:hypothetical protein